MSIANEILFFVYTREKSHNSEIIEKIFPFPQE
jgi:hypothetical protein